MTHMKKIALLGFATATLTACGHSPNDFEVATRKHREIKATEETHVLKIEDVSSGVLSENDRQRVEAFGAFFDKDGYGKLVITAPEQGENTQFSVSEVRSILSSVGVRIDQVSVGPYTGYTESGATPMVLAFKTYEAHVPGCSTVNEHDWTDASSNTTLPSFGCAVNENIALMLANPGDVRGEREIGPGDSSRQLTVYEKYRLGQDTSSSQQADGSSTTGGSGS